MPAMMVIKYEKVNSKHFMKRVGKTKILKYYSNPLKKTLLSSFIIQCLFHNF